MSRLRFADSLACFSLLVLVSLPAAGLRADKEELEQEDEPRVEVDGEAQGEASQGGDLQSRLLEEGQKNLEEIQRLLDEVQNDLADKKTGASTQDKQSEAMKKMTRLIEKLTEASKQANQSGSGGQSQSQQQPQDGQQSGQQQKPGSKRENQKQLGSQKQQEQAQKNGEKSGEKKGEKDGEKPDQQGKEKPGQVPNNELAEGELPDNAEGQVKKRLRILARWGLLPEKMRDDTGSAAAKEAPTEYRDIIDRYYKRISDFYEKQNRR